MESGKSSSHYDLDSGYKSKKTVNISSAKKTSLLGRLTSMRNVLIGIFLVQIAMLVLLIVIINPPLVFEQLNAIKVINQVSELVSVPPSEVPIIARVGDGKLLPDIEELKKANEVNAQVYKDAQNGDYAIGFSSKLVIYRQPENKVIYEGDSPQKILEDAQTAIINSVTAKTKEAGLIPADSSEVPQVAIVTDPAQLKATNSAFYANALKNDVVATFSTSGVVVLYRPSTNEIINSGSYTTTIQ